VIAKLTPDTGGQHDFSKSRCHIHILLEGPTEHFSTSKITPSRNCIRPQRNSIIDADLQINSTPTPFYNSSLCSDLTLSSYSGLLETSNTRFDSFKDTCILGRVWLNQRGFSSQIDQGGFGNFEWALLTAFLMQGGGPNGKAYLSSEYGSYQAFKAILSFLATRDLISNPLQLGTSQSGGITTSVPMVLDWTTGFNLFFKSTNWSYQAVRILSIQNVLVY
jgi:U3 small nucleolar RNA-associated protein 22